MKRRSVHREQARTFALAAAAAASCTAPTAPSATARAESTKASAAHKHSVPMLSRRSMAVARPLSASMRKPMRTSACAFPRGTSRPWHDCCCISVDSIPDIAMRLWKSRQPNNPCRRGRPAALSLLVAPGLPGRWDVIQPGIQKPLISVDTRADAVQYVRQLADYKDITLRLFSRDLRKVATLDLQHDQIRWRRRRFHNLKEEAVAFFRHGS